VKARLVGSEPNPFSQVNGIPRSLWPFSSGRTPHGRSEDDRCLVYVVPRPRISGTCELLHSEEDIQTIFGQSFPNHQPVIDASSCADPGWNISGSFVRRPAELLRGQVVARMKRRENKIFVSERSSAG
jgi:hypothetical protein